MRYLILLLLLFSSISFAAAPSPTCTGATGNSFCPNSSTYGNCPSGASMFLQNPAACSGQGSYQCRASCSCPSGYVLSRYGSPESPGAKCDCPAGTKGYDTQLGHFCGPASCPEGQIINITSSGVSCIVDPEANPENPDDLCPSGYPKVNGECPVCPLGFNPDGTCIGGSCPADKITQGYINGHAICIGQCTPPQVWGSVNGIEGCYGAPACPNGGSYGSVNGVPGCYGGDNPSGGNNSSSGGAGGSSGSGGAGGSSGSGGAGGSSGSGGAGGSSGSGGDGGSGGTGGGTSGNSGGNNGPGADYPEFMSCPTGYVKEGTKCVTEDKGDCPANYHQLVISQDPFLFWCVPDDPPQSSSSSSQSSPQSSSSSSKSSQNSSHQSNSDSASSGAASSGDSDGDSSSGSGSSAASKVTGGESCEEEPKCTGDAIQCSQLLQQWNSRCGGKLSDKFFDLPDQGDDRASFSKSLTTFKTELEKLPNTQTITNFFKFSGSGSCPVWSVNTWIFDIVIDQQCSPSIPWGLISGVIIGVAVLLAARIALT